MFSCRFLSALKLVQNSKLTDIHAHALKSRSTIGLTNLESTTALSEIFSILLQLHVQSSVAWQLKVSKVTWLAEMSLRCHHDHQSAQESWEGHHTSLWAKFLQTSQVRPLYDVEDTVQICCICNSADSSVSISLSQDRHIGTHLHRIHLFLSSGDYKAGKNWWQSISL